MHAFRFFSQYELQLASIYFPTSLGYCELYGMFLIPHAYTTMAIRSLICSFHLLVFNNFSLTMWLTDLTSFRPSSCLSRYLIELPEPSTVPSPRVHCNDNSRIWCFSIPGYIILSDIPRTSVSLELWTDTSRFTVDLVL